MTIYCTFINCKTQANYIECVFDINTKKIVSYGTKRICCSSHAIEKTLDDNYKIIYAYKYYCHDSSCLIIPTYGHGKKPSSCAKHNITGMDRISYNLCIECKIKTARD